MSQLRRPTLTATALAAFLTLAGCAGTTSTGGATSALAAGTTTTAAGTTTAASTATTATGATTSAANPPETATSPPTRMPTTQTTDATPRTTQATTAEAGGAMATIGASPESLANYVRTAVQARDRATVKAAMTSAAAGQVDLVLDSIPPGAQFEPPKCASAGNSMTMHCTMFVKGAPFVVELSTAKNPSTGNWTGTALSYDSTN